eukprot:TRINITY_DN189_c0_g1_i2.p1 TRINITY_DN189_c0_g1~~TRINITY_DN189_c0_g1_i2.p1  ORF type:complete len:334 (-),score=91.85 TRINITY_DN189_c0_g1_i2:316-1317(-)
MCIRDRYQRRVHGVNNKKIQNNQSITYFISQQTMYGSIFEFIKPFKPDGPAPAFKVISERGKWPTTKDCLDRVEEYLYPLPRYPILDAEKLNKIYSMIDLTSLNTTDAPQQLTEWLNKYLSEELKPAAICVYPNFTSQVKQQLKGTKITTASVAGGFPTSQTFLDVKILESTMAKKQGAQEVDISINRGLWNEKQDDLVFDEIIKIKQALGAEITLKVILEICELKDLAAVYKLSYLSLLAGADFIKTSTGKGKSGAELNAFAVMCLAMKDFYNDFQEKRGIKAAGGIQTPRDAWKYLRVYEAVFGVATPKYFRIGASSLADQLLYEYKLKKK